jgi:hypothetical protein
MAGEPESNGAVERQMRTLFEGVRAILLDIGLPAYYWAFAVAYHAYLRNRVPRRGETRTPYEVLYGAKPDISHVHQFGCSAIYYERTDGGKLAATGHRARFLGVVAGGFGLHCLESKRLVFKRHVRFTHLPPSVALVPALEPAATLNELQELQEDALACEPFDYVRSDDSDEAFGGESDESDSDSGHYYS